VMREPFETLLAHFRGHWWVDQHLQDEVPDWEAILTNPYWNALSGGEAILLEIALAIYNNDRTATIADIALLDEINKRRVIHALAVACDVV
jgi:hypothetical protein